jgi:hypothetical protein
MERARREREGEGEGEGERERERERERGDPICQASMLETVIVSLPNQKAVAVRLGRAFGTISL